MKALILVGLFSMVASTSFAINEQNPPAVIKVDMTTGRSDNAAKFDLTQEDNGLRVTMDPNRCGNPGPCTKMAIRSEVVTPRVVGNSVAADGSITISLGDGAFTRGLYLIVTNKMNGDQDVHLEIIKAADGGPVTRLPLKPLLKVGILK